MAPIAFLTIVLGNPSAFATDSKPGPAFVDPDPGEADKLCTRVVLAEPPLADQPTPTQRQALHECDGEALLYGIGRPADPVQARLCAFVQRETPTTGPGPGSGLFDGNGLLMTIYANGLGVPRNRAVATHLACTGVWDAPAEHQIRVPHLAGTLTEPWYKHDFSPCDDITSGYTGGVCAAHQSRIDATSRTTWIDAYASRLPPQARARLVTLRTAQARWAEARAGDEIDLSGTGRTAFEIAEQDLQTDDFLAMLTRLQKSSPPRLGTLQVKAAQARMDTALRTLLAVPPDQPIMGTITADGIRKAQTTWLAYRDAWAAFAAVAYPGWGPNGARAWVTMKRADMLTHLLSQHD